MRIPKKEVFKLHFMSYRPGMMLPHLRRWGKGLLQGSIKLRCRAGHAERVQPLCHH
jgi:hypothetical protein